MLPTAESTFRSEPRRRDPAIVRMLLTAVLTILAFGSWPADAFAVDVAFPGLSLGMSYNDALDVVSGVQDRFIQTDSEIQFDLVDAQTHQAIRTKLSFGKAGSAQTLDVVKMWVLDTSGDDNLRQADAWQSRIAAMLNQPTILNNLDGYRYALH